MIKNNKLIKIYLSNFNIKIKLIKKIKKKLCIIQRLQQLSVTLINMT